MGLEQLFRSTYYKKDASLLAQDISFEARKNIKCAEEEVAKLKYVQLAISEGVSTLGQTLCQDCNSKLHNKISRSLESKTAKRCQWKKMRLPLERQHFIKEIECILIQKEMSKLEGDIAEQYVTTDEWYEQEISDLRVQHENELMEFTSNRDTLKKEINDLKKLNKELMDQHEKEINQLQKVNVSNETRISAKDEIIRNNEIGRTTDTERIARLQKVVKLQDSRIIELTKPNRQEKWMQTDPPLEPETKSTHWFSLGGGSRKEEIKNLSTENKQLLSDLQKTQGEMNREKSKLQQTSNELSKTKSQLDELRNENAKLVEDYREQKEKFENVLLVKEKLESDIDSRLQEKDQTEKSLKEKNSELTRVLSRLETLNTEKTALTDDLREQKQKFEMAEEKLTSDTHSILQQKEQIEKTLQKRNSELTLVKSQVETLYTEKTTLTDDLRDKEIELRTLREHLEENRYSRKKSIVMGLHCSRGGLGKPLVEMVVRELTKGVQDRLDRNSTNLAIQFSQTPSEVTCWLKVVLCLNMSRVGTNILDVLKGMKGDRDVFVLVLHHTNKANLSSLTPTSHRITGSELRQLGGILDMAFSSDSGLYECDLNNNAIDKIASVLKKYMMI